jgi:hypothetical protein
VKVGDLVKFESVLEKEVFETDPSQNHGLVVQMFRPEHDSESAQVLFTDGELWWMDTKKLRLVNEAG